MRYAVYFTPPERHRLTAAASAWLGRDPFANGPVPRPPVGGLLPEDAARLSAAPRRYGFHATIVAPFRLGPGKEERDLVRAFDAFCEAQRSFAIPGPKVARLDDFLALVPTGPCRELEELAQAAVEHFNPIRAALSELEIERRNPDALSARQFLNLVRYGYPHVMEDFRFHMTLTGPVSAEACPRLQAILGAYFAPALAETLEIDGLALFVEPEPGAPFIVHTHRRFGTEAARKSA